VLLPLLSGYVFCFFDVLRQMPTRITPGVFGVVSRDWIAEPLPDAQISAIQLTCSTNPRSRHCLA
jgi:hypothetical protein